MPAENRRTIHGETHRVEHGEYELNGSNCYMYADGSKIGCETDAELTVPKDEVTTLRHRTEYLTLRTKRLNRELNVAKGHLTEIIQCVQADSRNYRDIEPAMEKTQAIHSALEESNTGLEEVANQLAAKTTRQEDASVAQFLADEEANKRKAVTAARELMADI